MNDGWDCYCLLTDSDLALAATGTAAGVMFHVLMILLILSLTGVFTHSTIRLFMLTKSAKQRRRDRGHTDRWHGQARQTDGTYFGEIPRDTLEQYDVHLPETPIRVIMAEDEECSLEDKSRGPPVKPPPPVYGHFRTSKVIFSFL